ncbi:MAG: TspO/MBR family protein [Burkholderiaceae bacterium]
MHESPAPSSTPPSAKSSLRLQSLVAAGIALSVAAAGGALTILDDWYYGLIQPSFKPPDWAFGPAWTLLFILMAISGVLGWRAAPDNARRQRLVALWAFNIVCNLGWSLLFFYLQRPDWAVIEVVFLAASVALLILHLRPYSPRAAWLLVPYLAWVCFAAAVNLGVVLLN